MFKSLKFALPLSRIRMNRHAATVAVLPRLPVPDLQKTLAKYLDSLRPLLLEDAAHGGPPYEDAFALRKKWADEFAAGLGSLCQERLQGQLLPCLIISGNPFMYFSKSSIETHPITGWTITSG